MVFQQSLLGYIVSNRHGVSKKSHFLRLQRQEGNSLNVHFVVGFFSESDIALRGVIGLRCVIGTVLGETGGRLSGVGGARRVLERG